VMDGRCSSMYSIPFTDRTADERYVFFAFASFLFYVLRLLRFHITTTMRSKILPLAALLCAVFMPDDKTETEPSLQPNSNRTNQHHQRTSC
jgi:hypothetical protein